LLLNLHLDLQKQPYIFPLLKILTLNQQFMKLQTKSLFLASALLVSSCVNNPYSGEREVGSAAKYSAGGVAAGALAGFLAGGDTKATLIGAAVGGVAGGGYGYYRDVQAQKLRQVLAGTGVQVKEEGNDVRLIMPGNITFPTGRSALKSSFYSTLKSVSLVVKEYKKTNIVISGYTDSVGTEARNLTLSQDRAESVANYLSSEGVARSRLRTIGYGESSPIASNKTTTGRSLNRRVEIRLTPIR
jgi:outer membrane protein OmpA-like peptidoglycan-associated protein